LIELSWGAEKGLASSWGVGLIVYNNRFFTPYIIIIAPQQQFVRNILTTEIV
jgi:hypothetical protein